MMKPYKYVLLYTLLFTFLFYGCCGIYFAEYDVSLFWKVDGYRQHYTAFLYIGIWLQEIFQNLSSNSNVPLWNHGMGYGSDIPTTLIAYIFDPFNYLSAVFPQKWSEYIYNGIIIFKLYLCGLSFSYFAFYRGYKWQNVLAGALVYTFCGSSYIVFTQMYFINPMYLFPLLIVSFDRLWDKKQGGMYAVMLTICFLNHFYFAYMMCIFLFGYAAFRLAEDCMVKQFNYQKILFTGIYTLCALGISAVILLPIAYNLIQQGRMEIDYDNPILYDFDHYQKLLFCFIHPFQRLNRDCIIGFSIMILPLIYVFFTNKGNYRLKIEFCLLTICLCIPFLGYILNGFSYPANRWIWAYCLVIAYIVTITLPMVEKKKFWHICIFMAVYTLICGLLCHHLLFIILCISAVFVILLWYCALQMPERIRTFIVLVGIICSSFLSSNYFMIENSKQLQENVRYKTAYEGIVNDAEIQTARRILANDIRRFNTPQFSGHNNYNTTWLYQLSGFGLYMSIYNEKIDQFHRQLALLTFPWVTQYAGLNRRAELLALLGVEYMIKSSKYKKTQFTTHNRLILTQTTNDGDYEAYASDIPTSLIYGFDKAISAEEFEQFSPYERQQVLLQAVVVAQPDTSLSAKHLIIQNNSIPFEFWNNKIVENYHKFRVNALLKNLYHFSFDPLQHAELYLYFNGLDCKEKKAQMYTINFITGQSADPEVFNTELYGNNKYVHIYGNKHEWLVNLGYLPTPIDEVQMYIRPDGLYEIKNMAIYARSDTDIRENIARLKPLGSNISFTDNTFKFDAVLDKKQYVFISIPYSTGWKAYVNNKETPVIVADTAFMALLLEAGTYNIELKYETPYLKLGFIISLISLMMLIFLQFIKKSYKVI